MDNELWHLLRHRGMTRDVSPPHPHRDCPLDHATYSKSVYHTWYGRYTRNALVLARHLVSWAAMLDYNGRVLLRSRPRASYYY